MLTFWYIIFINEYQFIFRAMLGLTKICLPCIQPSHSFPSFYYFSSFLSSNHSLHCPTREPPPAWQRQPYTTPATTIPLTPACNRFPLFSSHSSHLSSTGKFPPIWTDSVIFYRKIIISVVCRTNFSEIPLDKISYLRDILGTSLFLFYSIFRWLSSFQVCH